MYRSLKRTVTSSVTAAVLLLSLALPAMAVEDTAAGTAGIAPISCAFTDVQPGSYYEQAVNWAVGQEITTGTGETQFSPELPCTRAQTVTFLWRAAGSPVVDAVNPFQDVDGDDYYYNAVLWALENGITNGTKADTFSPNDTVTRGQVVTFLWRSAGSPKPETTTIGTIHGDAEAIDIPFTDICINDAYYDNAVVWAYQQKIAAGVTSDAFRPELPCTRAQIVTFLYRAVNDKQPEKPAEGNAITELFAEGYVCTASTADETQWKGLFQEEDSNEVIYFVRAAMTEEQYKAYSEHFAEDGPEAEAQMREILGSLTQVTVKEITDIIPTQEELNAYVGKTIGELEADGFELSGWVGDVGMGFSLFYDGPVYVCMVTPTEAIEDMDNYSDDDIRTLKIGEISFAGISSAFLDTCDDTVTETDD